MGVRGGAAVECLEVACDEGFDGGGDGDLLGGAAELVEEHLQAAAVVGEEQIARHGEGVARGDGVDEGIAVAIAADPGAELDQLREGGEVDGGEVCGAACGRGGERDSECGGDLVVEDGEGAEERGLVVVEGHADLVADGGARGADVVGLPEGGDLGEEVAFEGVELGGADGDAVELLEEVGDAAALEHDGAARDLGGMRGEDGGDTDAIEEAEDGGAVEPGLAKGGEGSAQAAALGRRVGAEVGGEASALAVVGLGEVDEFEVEGEGAGEAVGAVGVGGELVDAEEGLLQVGAGRGQVSGAGGLGLAARDGGAAEALDGLEEGVACLLAQHGAEQDAERTDVAAQGGGLQVRCARLKLG